MANWYVYNGATGGATGVDWTNAVTTLAAGLALAGYVAGDTFYVAHDHAETQGSAMTLTFKGIVTAVDRVICVNRAGSVPPVSADLRATATITTTGNFGIVIGGAAQFAYIEGINFSAGSGAVSATIQISFSSGYFKNCQVAKAGTTAGSMSIIPTSGSVGASLVFDNTTVKFGVAGDNIANRGYDFLWKNTPLAIAGGISPLGLFTASASSNVVISRLDGVDLRSLGANKINSAGGMPHKIILSNCILGVVGSVANTPGGLRWGRVEVLNCDSLTGATNYRNEIYDYAAILTTEIVIVRAGGASDGTTSISWKIISSVNARPQAVFESFPIAQWNAAVGSPKTLAVEMVNDNFTLTNADVWIEVEYLGSSGSPIASLVSSGIADVLAAGSAYPTSSATWTTTGLASPVKQTISVTFTPQMAGYVRAVVKMAKFSKTIYVDPKVTIT